MMMSDLFADCTGLSEQSACASKLLLWALSSAAVFALVDSEMSFCAVCQAVSSESTGSASGKEAC